MRLLVLNGPNLNLLGSRRPEVYGTTTLPELEGACRRWGDRLGHDVETYQSNHEGALIDRLHAARGSVDGVVFNPGAFTHSSYALHDAIEAIELPVVEVHISDVDNREPWRRISVVRPACVHTISGRGVDGYRWAIRHLHWRRARPGERVPYGEHPDQFVVTRVPPSATASAVFVHGGFWRGMWTFDTIEGPAVDLAEAGLATAVVEYRRTGTDHPGPEAIVDDVSRAIRSASEQTGVPPERTVVIGHSAGAQLALLAAARTGAASAVSLAGVLDLAAAADLDGGAVGAYLAGSSPESFSPSDLVPLGLPIVVANAAGDTEIPSEQAERFTAAATAAGDDVRAITVPGDHYSFLDPTTEAWAQIRPVILGLVRPEGRQPDRPLRGFA